MLQTTLNKHIYYVFRGEEIENGVFASHDGFIWFDETEQTGDNIVYPKFIQCKNALNKYCIFLEKESNDKTTS